MSDNDIWREYKTLQEERRRRAEAVMHEYDTTIYYPKLGALRKRCREIGHRPQSEYHFTVSGIPYRYCSQCGVVIMEKRDDDDERFDSPTA